MSSSPSFPPVRGFQVTDEEFFAAALTHRLYMVIRDANSETERETLASSILDCYVGREKGSTRVGLDAAGLPVVMISDRRSDGENIEFVIVDEEPARFVPLPLIPKFESELNARTRRRYDELKAELSLMPAQQERLERFTPPLPDEPASQEGQQPSGAANAPNTDNFGNSPANETDTNAYAPSTSPVGTEGPATTTSKPTSSSSGRTPKRERVNDSSEDEEFYGAPPIKKRRTTPSASPVDRSSRRQSPPAADPNPSRRSPPAIKRRAGTRASVTAQAYTARVTRSVAARNASIKTEAAVDRAAARKTADESANTAVGESAHSARLPHGAAGESASSGAPAEKDAANTAAGNAADNNTASADNAAAHSTEVPAAQEAVEHAAESTPNVATGEATGQVTGEARQTTATAEEEVVEPPRRRIRRRAPLLRREPYRRPSTGPRPFIQERGLSPRTKERHFQQMTSVTEREEAKDRAEAKRRAEAAAAFEAANTIPTPVGDFSRPGVPPPPPPPTNNPFGGSGRGRGQTGAARGRGGPSLRQGLRSQRPGSSDVEIGCPYAELGVEKPPLGNTYSDRDMRKFYNRARLACHPDKNRDDQDGAHLRFLRVEKAYPYVATLQQRLIIEQADIQKAEAAEKAEKRRLARQAKAGTGTGNRKAAGGRGGPGGTGSAAA